MTEPTVYDIHEMRRLMAAATPGGDARRLSDSARGNAEDRVVQITEHLYRHLQRTDTDDFLRGLGRRLEAIQAVQAVDGLYEAFRYTDRSSVVAYSRHLHERLEYCSPDQIAAILGHTGFPGQELDVAGLVTMLGDALADLDGRPRPRLAESVAPDRFDALVQDIAQVVREWSTPQMLTEGHEGLGEPEDYAGRLRSLLEDNYGIRLDVNRG